MQSHVGEVAWSDYTVEVTWADGGAPSERQPERQSGGQSGAIDCFDVILRRKGQDHAVPGPAATAAPRKPWQAYANDPSRVVAESGLLLALTLELYETLLPELRAYLKDKLPAFMVPTALVVLDALPLTPNGKIDRKALPAPDRARQESASAYQAPTHELERAIAAVWQELLTLEQISTVDNLFDLGANSLLMVRANGKLRTALGRELSLIDMFQYPTVKSLAAFLGQGDEPVTAAGATTLQQSQERGQSRRDALQRRRDQRSGPRNS